MPHRNFIDFLEKHPKTAVAVADPTTLVKPTEANRRTAAWIAEHPWLAAVCAPASALVACPYAYAVSPSEALATILGYVSKGVTLIGGAVVVFGAVQLGLAIKDGATGGGGQLSGAIAMIVGGAVVVVAGTYFGTLDTSLS